MKWGKTKSFPIIFYKKKQVHNITVVDLTGGEGEI